MAELSKNPSQPALNIKTISYGDLTWVDITNPTEEVKKYLSDRFNFHPMDLEDVLSKRQLSKIEEYQQYVFFIFHIPVFDKTTQVSTKRQWCAFAGEKFLVTLRPIELQVIDEMLRESEFNEDSRKEFMGKGSGYLLYSILDHAVDAYFPILDKILSLMDDIEDRVFDEGVEVAREINILRRDIITQRRVMFPERALQADVQNKLKRFSKIDLSVYFSDLSDHVNKICDTLDEAKEIIEVFKDADSTLSNYRSNRVIRTLALMFAIGFPVILIAGIFAMNVLPTGISGNLGTFIIVLAVMVVIIVLLLLFFRRRKLI
jgi:magnesium transporter